MARIDINDCAFAIRKAREDDQHLPIIDNTRLTAVNTCPRWAGIRYGHNKIMGAATGRALALEVGTACHHSFAAIRLLQLAQGAYYDHAAYHAKRLFPKLDAHMELMSMLVDNTVSTHDKLREVALFGLEYSEYYDDPSDKKRTLVNMEEAIVKYANRYNPHERKVWIKDANDPTSLVGIEIPFDYVIEVKSIRGTFADKRFRFVGRIDGISVNSAEKVVLEENKTTSQINAAWLSNWAMAHQITGYMVVASAMTMQHVREGEVIGLAIPQPKSSPYDGLVREYVTRNESQINQWLAWFMYSAEEFDIARHDPLGASTFTHSCTRYFRECSLLPLCCAEKEDQKNIFDNEMHVDEWNPLAEEGDAA